jgi:hypothetical protein
MIHWRTHSSHTNSAQPHEEELLSTAIAEHKIDMDFYKRQLKISQAYLEHASAQIESAVARVCDDFHNIAMHTNGLSRQVTKHKGNEDIIHSYSHASCRKSVLLRLLCTAESTERVGLFGVLVTDRNVIQALYVTMKIPWRECNEKSNDRR